MLAAPMFAPRRAMSLGAAAYQSTGVEIQVAGADPHRLVSLLFEGFDSAVTDAQGGLSAGDVERKCRAITRAIRIVDEGLRGHLNMEAGGTLAHDLMDLYGYIVRRLMQANARNDYEMLSECKRLMQPLREAWDSIGGQAAVLR